MREDDNSYSCRAAYFEALEDRPVNPSDAPTLGDVIQRRFSRRDVIKGMLGVAAIGTLAPLSAMVAPARAAGAVEAAGSAAPASRFGFAEISHGADATHHVAPGYSADVLIRWGDPVTAAAPAFDPAANTPDAQRAQFGYNNDYIGYVPLPFGSGNPEHGLLCINHEYTDEELMFPGYGRHDKDFARADQRIVDIEMAAHGGTIVEVRKQDGKWQVVPDSRYARRITALDTPTRVSGPAAGHDRMKTGEDPTGTRVVGTINNCAGGITPWGTYLMAEENFHFYFQGSLEGNPEKANYERYGVPGNRYAWAKFHRRFNLDAEPNAANGYGWIVEVDPLDPESVPVKRTALGRFKHEGAESIVNGDGRLVVYSGDDQRFEFLYKFVTDGKVDMQDRAANRDLLDSGTLYAARFDADGTVEWLPLVQGQGPLTVENGFASQADVVIEARRAATLLGATPMDRPEDVDPNPQTGKVYVMLTNNSRRTADQVDAANPRPDNIWGHIIELTADAGDHASTRGRWDVLVKAGNPSDPGTAATWNPATSENGWFACPDNCAVDPSGRLWVTTDQGSNWSKASGTADGVWALDTDGDARGTGRMFYRCPVGAEMCGPCFTPDGKTLFVAVQHPATDGTKDFPGFERASTYEDPATRWPDFRDDLPPRPSVVAITKDDGGPIGS